MTNRMFIKGVFNGMLLGTAAVLLGLGLYGQAAVPGCIGGCLFALDIRTLWLRGRKA